MRFPKTRLFGNKKSERGSLNRDTVRENPRSQRDSSMRRTRTIASAAFVLMTLLTGKSTLLSAETQPISSSAQDTTAQDTKAIDAIVHSNPSDHFAEDGSFTNIFGTVRYGREEFKKRHVEIAQSIFKGTSVKSSIGKLRFVRPDVVIVDVTGK
jgi:hypothetical protein